MKKHLLIAVAVLGIVASCKKEESSTPKTNPVAETPLQKAVKILSANDWKIASMSMGLASGPLIPVPMDDCEKDNYMRFANDYKLTTFYGTNKCDSAESDQAFTVYALNTAADSITIDAGEYATKFALVNLSANGFEATTIADGYKQKIVFVKK